MRELENKRVRGKRTLEARCPRRSVMAIAEKPDLRERLGAALNSSDLSPDLDRERPIDLIAALGYTQINPDAEDHREQDVAVVDPRTELGALLMRVKYGGDRAISERAGRLLVQWIRHQRAFRKWKLRANGESLVEKFARTALAEWLDPVCLVCSGREFLGLERGTVVQKHVRCGRCGGSGEVRVLPTHATYAEYGVRPIRRRCNGCNGMGRKTEQRTVKRKPGECYACRGTGVHRASDAERARSLGIDVKVYQRHWVRRFGWIGAALDRLDHLEKNCLRAQMEHGIKRS